MKFSLAAQAFTALFLGIAFGVVLGPICSALQPIGEIYVMLLKMAVLPYIGFSLIHGLGSMTPSLGRKLLKKGWICWVAIWAVAFGTIYLLYLLIPSPSSAIVEVGKDKGAQLAKSFLNYLVPENPFYDLVNNVIPAIATCGIIFGVALMHMQNKEPLLSLMERGTQLIEKILMWLAIISPIGIFARTASTFGIVKFKDLFVFEFYVVGFIAATLLITFWALPALVASLTPISYKEIVKAIRTVCILPFATGLTTIALPFIVLYLKSLGKKHTKDPEFHATSQTVLPICYSFGQIGNCMILFFIFYLSFFFKHPFTISEKWILSLFTLPMSVGSSTSSISAVSFLVEQLEFPEESVELFMHTFAITTNFQVLASSASILCLVILILYSYYRILTIQWKKAFYHFSSILVVSLVSIAAVKQVWVPKDNFQNQYMALRIRESTTSTVPVTILEKAPLQTEPFNKTAILQEILRTGVLKVGFSPLDMPYAYKNEHGELVGYDIAYAYELAKDLDCRLEFIPIEYGKFIEQMQQGVFHIAMSAIVMNEAKIKYMDFTVPYAEENVVMIVPLAKRSRFLNLESVAKNDKLRIGAIGAFQEIVKMHLPLASFVLEEDLEGLLKGSVDAWLTLRREGFVWTLSQPDFAMIDYEGALGKSFLAYPIPMGDADWLTFLNSWLALKEQSGFKHTMTQYWLEGESIRKEPRRWSLIRNVLHWVD